MKPMLKAPGNMLLKLRYDGPSFQTLLSSLILRRCTKDAMRSRRRRLRVLDLCCG